MEFIFTLDDIKHIILEYADFSIRANEYGEICKLIAAINDALTTVFSKKLGGINYEKRA